MGAAAATLAWIAAAVTNHNAMRGSASTTKRHPNVPPNDPSIDLSTRARRWEYRMDGRRAGVRRTIMSPVRPVVVRAMVSQPAPASACAQARAQQPRPLDTRVRAGLRARAVHWATSCAFRVCAGYAGRVCAGYTQAGFHAHLRALELALVARPVEGVVSQIAVVVRLHRTGPRRKRASGRLPLVALPCEGLFCLPRQPAQTQSTPPAK